MWNQCGDDAIANSHMEFLRWVFYNSAERQIQPWACNYFANINKKNESGFYRSVIVIVIDKIFCLCIWCHKTTYGINNKINRTLNKIIIYKHKGNAPKTTTIPTFFWYNDYLSKNWRVFLSTKKLTVFARCSFLDTKYHIAFVYIFFENIHFLWYIKKHNTWLSCGAFNTISKIVRYIDSFFRSILCK